MCCSVVGIVWEEIKSDSLVTFVFELYLVLAHSEPKLTKLSDQTLLLQSVQTLSCVTVIIVLSDYL